MKKMMMTCWVGLSAFTCSTSSFADGTTSLKDSNGNILKTDKMYCVRPTVLEPKVYVAVGDSEYVKVDENSVDCQYAYKLVGDDRVSNRTVTAGETVRFEEMKKESDGTYRKTNNFLKAKSNGYIRSTKNEYVIVPDLGNLPKLKTLYEVAKFRLESTSNNNSELQIKYNGNSVWKVPYSVEAGEKWVQLQDQNNATGITTFIFEPVE